MKIIGSLICNDVAEDNTADLRARYVWSALPDPNGYPVEYDIPDELITDTYKNQLGFSTAGIQSSNRNSSVAPPDTAITRTARSAAAARPSHTKAATESSTSSIPKQFLSTRQVTMNEILFCRKPR